MRVMKALVIGASLAALTGSTATPAEANESVQRPYKTKLTGVVEITSACSVGVSTLTCQAEWFSVETGTHIGKATSTAAGSVSLDTSAPCEDSEGRAGVVVTSVRQGVIVAGNGSELVFEADTTGCSVQENGLDLTESFGLLTFTDGSGRFVGASGTIDLIEETAGDTVPWPGSSFQTVGSTIGIINY